MSEAPASSRTFAPQGSGPVGIGIIGAGVISQQYLTNLTAFPDVKVVALGDLFPEAAKARAEEFAVPHHGGVDAVLNNPEVELVINLTIPAAHVEVGERILAAGKHVFSEKPFSLDRESGFQLLNAANEAGLRVGCAPDTFLGAGLQTVRRLIERGDIGTPLTALTLMQSSGPERWHPNPAFLFARGAGPLFDMGPYYLTALSQFFGSFNRVAAFGSQVRQQRTIAKGPKAGDTFPVEVPTHVGALLGFENGASAQSIFSFESPRSRGALFEITGSEATLVVPDPNTFNGEIRLFTPENDDGFLVPLEGADAGRGMGALDMARGIRAGQPHRASGELAFHIVDAMVSVDEAVSSGTFVDVASQAPITAALPADWDPFEATLGAS